MTDGETLYKYRTFSAQSLSMLIDRAFYFPEPSELNDPFDCQISIRDALRSGIEIADNATDNRVTEKLANLGSLEKLYEKIESNVSKVGVLSLSKLSTNPLMWTHYADENRGFCLGFQLTARFTEYNKEHFIVGCCSVKYFDTNPFSEYFEEFANSNDIPSLNDFCESLMSMGMVAKGSAWSYEEEVRVLRTNAGSVPFDPRELDVVIFGGQTTDRHRVTLRKLLSGPEWEHVEFRQIVKATHDFSLRIEAA